MPTQPRPNIAYALFFKKSDIRKLRCATKLLFSSERLKLESGAGGGNGDHMLHRDRSLRTKPRFTTIFTTPDIRLQLRRGTNFELICKLAGEKKKRSRIRGGSNKLKR
jgi:hypothetical protein